MEIEYEENNQLTNNEVAGIYLALSTSDNTNIDVLDGLQFVQTCIEELFDAKFRMIETDKLQDNSLLINQKFVELIKYCNTKAKFRKVGYIFIGFTDYFDLDAEKTFKQLHEKIQMLIKHSTKCMCGSSTYEKLEKKNVEHPEIKIPTLFNLTNKKK